MSFSLFDKIWESHTIAPISEEEDLIYVDRIFLHERTGGIALKTLAEKSRSLLCPEQVFCTFDHIVDTRPGRDDTGGIPGGEVFIRTTREEAKRAGVTLFDIDDPRQGIVHVISPEQGITLPGLTIVCPDSHTCTNGALGALGWGIGSSDAEHALATQSLRLQRPKTMRVLFDSAAPKGVAAKDLILYLISRHGAAGGRGFALEFAGQAIRDMEVEARMTLCNMAVEFSAFSGLVSPDEKTLAYVKGRPYAPRGEMLDKAQKEWLELASEPEADFDREIEMDAGAIGPMVTWGTSPEHAVFIEGEVPDPKTEKNTAHRRDMERALEYMDIAPGTPMEKIPVDAAFIGSCTNSRLSDLRAAAEILKGRQVAEGVRAVCVPGSTAVKQAAEAEGLDKAFKSAGFEWRESGCSMCFYAGGETFGPEKRVITTTNRNFEGRQGPRTRSHLASPATVAASAVAGRIARAAP